MKLHPLPAGPKDMAPTEVASVIRALPSKPAIRDAAFIGTLRAISARLPADPERTRSIDRLARGAVVVLAGQQPALFGGPLYSTIKIAAAIALAERLTAAGRDAVPVFWNASEDHDLDEANRAYFLSPKDHTVGLMRADLPHEGRSLSEITFTAAIIEGLRRRVDSTARHAAPLMPEIGENFGNWNTRIFDAFFRHTGLLIVEPADLAPHAVAIRRRWVENASEAAALFGDARRERAARGETSALDVDLARDLGLFVTIDGRRRKLVRNADGFVAGSERFDRRALSGLIGEAPTRITSGVVVRPLVQQAVFGDVLQIAGPSEMLYLRELDPLFRLFDLSAPVLWQRPSFLTAFPADVRAASAAGLSFADLAQSPAAWPRAATGSDPAFSALLDRFRGATGVELSPAPGMDGPARDVRQRAAARAMRAIRDVEDRFRTLDRRRTKPARFARKALEERLWPRAHPQERIFHLGAFPEIAPDEFARTILAAARLMPAGRHLLEIS